MKVKKKKLKQFLLTSLVVFLLACQVKPEAINFGKDHCAYCKMSIVDPKYGGELVTDKGRIYKFDAVECMIPFIKENQSTTFRYQLAVAYDQPEELIPVVELTFARAEKYQSPMGANVAAFSNENMADDNAEIFDWKSLYEKRMKLQ